MQRRVPLTTLWCVMSRYGADLSNLNFASPNFTKICQYRFHLDIVGTVYHLVIYIYVVQQDTQCGLNE